MTVTKRIALSAASILVLAAALTQGATAADLAPQPYTKAPPPIVPAIYDWTGFYIGMNAGWGSAQNTLHEHVITNATVGSFRAEGATVGGQIGYRWQMSQWVFGLEAQGNWADFRGHDVNRSLIGFESLSATKIVAFGLFTAQLGYAWNNMLLYVKGGAAVTHAQHHGEIWSNGALLTVVHGDSSSQWNGTVGAGLEWGFAPKWSLGVEYNHIFGNSYHTRYIDSVTGAISPGAFTNGGDIDLVTVRLNYAWGPSVFPKY